MGLCKGSLIVPFFTQLQADTHSCEGNFYMIPILSECITACYEVEVNVRCHDQDGEETIKNLVGMRPCRSTLILRHLTKSS